MNEPVKNGNMNEDLESLLKKIFHEDDRMIKAFMERPHMLLEGKTPTEVTQTAKGVNQVILLLKCAEAGVAF